MTLTIREAARMWRIPERTLRWRAHRAGLASTDGRYHIDQLEPLATVNRARPPQLRAR